MAIWSTETADMNAEDGLVRVYGEEPVRFGPSWGRPGVVDLEDDEDDDLEDDDFFDDEDDDDDFLGDEGDDDDDFFDDDDDDDDDLD